MYISNKVFVAALSLNLMGLGYTANAAVVLLSESRSVSATASLNSPVGSESASSSRNSLGDFANFDKLVDTPVSIDDESAGGTAQQNSQISTTSITASGEALAHASLDLASGESAAQADLSVQFDVETPQWFDLSGVVLFNAGKSILGEASVSLTNTDGTFNIFFGNSGLGTSPGFDVPFDLSGTLFPDSYILSANAGAAIGVGAFEDSNFASFSFDFNAASTNAVSTTPIPAAAWLFGSGLLGLIGISRCKESA